MPETKSATDATEEIDAAEIRRGWTAIAARRPVTHTFLTWAARTDIGRLRENNEDKFDFFLPDDPTQLALRGRLWAVADGMGGHNAGQIASEAALKALIRTYYSPHSPEDTSEALRTALGEANGLIYRAARQLESRASGMGTTLVVAVVKEDMLTVAHIGDSRAYLLRRGEGLRRLTTDHSWVEEQVRRGTLSRADAEASPYRNYILRSVGVEAAVDAEILSLPIQPEDTLLLCTDGLSGYLGDDALAVALSGTSPAQIALDLIDAANDAGGKDNITALVARAHVIGPFPETWPAGVAQ
jgi:serine/threonine protein phosphatase PrpC